MKIHHLADVQSSQIGEGTVVWQYAVIMEGAIIGTNCNINCHTFIENNVRLGNNITIKSGVYLWTGIEIDDNVFVGPNATFTNDKYPRSKQYPAGYQKIRLGKGCSIGANATVLGGIEIGEYAIIGAGSVVTKKVPPFSLVIGNPAKVVGWVDEEGNKLLETPTGDLINSKGQKYRIEQDNLKKL